MMYGYTVNSELILEAWARYRPDYSINPYQKNTSKKEQREKCRRELNTIWTESFLNKLLSQVHLKIYNFKGTDIEKRRKRSFKENFIRTFKDEVEKE